MEGSNKMDAEDAIMEIKTHTIMIAFWVWAEKRDSSHDGEWNKVHMIDFW
jgi:hypothetical protein